MGAMAQITASIVYSTVCSGADQRRHQSSASLAFVRGIHRWAATPPHKGPVTRKMLRFKSETALHPRGTMEAYTRGQRFKVVLSRRVTVSTQRITEQTLLNLNATIRGPSKCQYGIHAGYNLRDSWNNLESPGNWWVTTGAMSVNDWMGVFIMASSSVSQAKQIYTLG